MGEHIRILYIDDDEDDYIIMDEILSDIQDLDYELKWVASFSVFKSVARHEQFDVFFIDYRVGQYTGVDILKWLKEINPGTPAIIVTGQSEHQIRKQAIRAGAIRFLIKGELTPENVDAAVQSALKKKQLDDSLNRLKNHLNPN